MNNIVHKAPFLELDPTMCYSFYIAFINYLQKIVYQYFSSFALQPLLVSKTSVVVLTHICDTIGQPCTPYTKSNLYHYNSTFSLL